MRVLTFEEIVELHDESIRVHGGWGGILNEGVIRSAVDAPFAGYGDYELYPSIVEKASTLCFSLVRGHGFRDGNKRVGLLALVTFLAVNGYLFEASNQEAERFIRELAEGQKTKEELFAWVRSRVETAPSSS